jgi:Flp pilus assembly protein TadD
VEKRELSMSRHHISNYFHWTVIGLAVLGLGCSTYNAARLYHTGTLALDEGDYDRAVMDLEQAAVLHPEASEVQNHLGLAYQAVGRMGEAELAFRHAVALDCRNAAAAENLQVMEARSALRVSSRRAADTAGSAALEAP